MRLPHKEVIEPDRDLVLIYGADARGGISDRAYSTVTELTSPQSSVVSGDAESVDGGIMLVDASNAPVTITLVGSSVTVKKIDSTSNPVHFSEPLDGIVQSINYQNTSLDLAKSDSDDWFIV